MKHTSYYLILACFLYSFVSCDTQQKSKYADRHGEVLDSIYASHETTIDGFFEDISWITNVAAFKEEQKHIKDTIISEENPSFEFPEISIFFSDTLRLTASNSIVLNKNTNLISASSFTDTIGVDEIQNKLPFTLTKYTAYDGGKVNSKYVSQPKYSRCYEDKNRFSSEDSITKDHKRKIVREEHTALESIAKIKYIILLNDTMIIEPVVLSEDSFQGGYIVSILQLYDIKSKRLLGQDVLLIENQNEMNNPLDGFGDMSLPDGFSKDVLQEQLRKDLIEQKNVRVFEAIHMLAE